MVKEDPIQLLDHGASIKVLQAILWMVATPAEILEWDMLCPTPMINSKDRHVTPRPENENAFQQIDGNSERCDNIAN